MLSLLGNKPVLTKFIIHYNDENGTEHQIHCTSEEYRDEALLKLEDLDIQVLDIQSIDIDDSLWIEELEFDTFDEAKLAYDTGEVEWKHYIDTLPTLENKVKLLDEENTLLMVTLADMYKETTQENLQLMMSITELYEMII